MKTAMQEAIKHFSNINNDLVNIPIQNVPYILMQFLEKEKEQIMRAHLSGQNSNEMDDDITEEEYYNDNYNN